MYTTKKQKTAVDAIIGDPILDQIPPALLTALLCRNEVYQMLKHFSKMVGFPPPLLNL